MELLKNKYKKAEVDKLLDENALIYREKIQELQEKIVDLSNENQSLSTQVKALKNNEELVLQTLTSAEKTAKNKDKASSLNYSACVKSLKSFSIKWAEYFNYILDKYPYYPALKQASDLKEELDLLFDRKVDDKALVEKTKKSLQKAQKTAGADFSPKEKIQDYIAATSDNGFNLDEVLNPGNLRLEDLCKELGLLEEND